jgi:hypothetical protein
VTIKLFTAAVIVFHLSISVGRGQKFSLGAKAGILAAYTNFAEETDKSKSNVMLKPGYSVAGIIDFPLKKSYSFQAEAGFSQQGRVISFSSDQQKNTSTYNFIDLAMGLRKSFNFNIKKDIASQWFVNIGPNINYWVSGNGRIDTEFGIPQDYSIVFNQTGTAYDKMYMNGVNRWLFGLNLGLGFNVTTLRNQRFITELRLTWGQTYLGNTNSAFWNNISFQGQESMKFNLKVLNFSVAYVFDKDIKLAKKGKSTKKR